MLEHQMTVLNAVSGNRELFRKELIKSLGWLDTEESNQFNKWLKENYWNEYSDIIKEAFS